MLTAEEWKTLSPEEQQNRSGEKPQEEIKEDMVIIDGKPRPLKNFIAEITRKVKDDVSAEINANKSQEQKKEVPPTEQDWRKRIIASATREMEESGEIVPVQTILDIVNQGIGYHIGQYAKTNKQASKIIKDTKAEIRKDCKEKGIAYDDYSDDFENILDDIEPQNVSAYGLKIIFNSVIGKKTPELIKKVQEDASRKSEEGGRRIVGGELAEGSGKPAESGGASKLTAEQKEEMLDMGFESEVDYIGRLGKYRDIAKKKGAKNTPNLISERFIFA
jgi:hypothetical protein